MRTKEIKQKECCIEFADLDSVNQTNDRNFFSTLVRNGVNPFIRNVKTDFRILRVDEHLLPITINEAEYHNSYVCSPYGQYVEYAKTSLPLIENPILRAIYGSLIAIQGFCYQRAELNKVVVVNNFLTSTCLYPALTKNQIQAIKNFLVKHYQNHAVIFRSVNECMNQEIMKGLLEHQFNLIASRYIYVTNTKNEEIFKTRIFKSDLRFLEKSEYEIIDETQFSSEDIERVLQLYTYIYLDKYSNINPQLTFEFLRSSITHKFLKFKALKKNGKIDGVIGYYNFNGVMMAPLLGYDNTIPDIGLYRKLCTILTLEAKNQGLVLHQSSGGSFFKKIRRAEGHLEYMAVFHHHLPFIRRLPWMFLKNFINTVAVPFMKKY